MAYTLDRAGAEVDAALDKADAAVQPPTLATVATSGSYTDLSNKPTWETAGAVATHEGAYAHGAIATALQPGHTAALSAAAGLTDLGEGVAITVPATVGRYLATITGDAELTFTAPGAGAASTAVVVQSRTVSTGTLAATYRAEDTEEGITAQAAAYSGSLVADTALRTALFLVGGSGVVDARFSATLSDASASDDPLIYTITDPAWYLVTVAYRAGAAATLDWEWEQTNPLGTLYLMAIDVTDPGATGAASLTISGVARSTRLSLAGTWVHYGREGPDTFDQLPGQTVIGALTMLGVPSQLTDGGAEIAFEGVAPATSYALTIAGESGYSGVPGAGYLRLDAVVLADGTRSINESQWIAS